MILAFNNVNPEPWSVGVNGKAPTLVAYQNEVREYIEREYPRVKPMDGDLELEMYFWRQVTGRTRNADATNLAKALEDALQGLVFLNDRSNRRVLSWVVRQDATVRPFILVFVQPIATKVPVWAEYAYDQGAPEFAPTRLRPGHLDAIEDVLKGWT